jgi:hypothetical protein
MEMYFQTDFVTVVHFSTEIVNMVHFQTDFITLPERCTLNDHRNSLYLYGKTLDSLLTGPSHSQCTDLTKQSVLPLRLRKEVQTRVRSIDWSPQGFAPDGG